MNGGQLLKTADYGERRYVAFSFAATVLKTPRAATASVEFTEDGGYRMYVTPDSVCEAISASPAFQGWLATAERNLRLLAPETPSLDDRINLPVIPDPPATKPEPDLAHAPPLHRVALLSDDVMAAAA